MTPIIPYIYRSFDFIFLFLFHSILHSYGDTWSLDFKYRGSHNILLVTVFSQGLGDDSNP